MDHCQFVRWMNSLPWKWQKMKNSMRMTLNIISNSCHQSAITTNTVVLVYKMSLFLLYLLIMPVMSRHTSVWPCVHYMYAFDTRLATLSTCICNHKVQKSGNQDGVCVYLKLGHDKATLKPPSCPPSPVNPFAFKTTETRACSQAVCSHLFTRSNRTKSCFTITVGAFQKTPEPPPQNDCGGSN